MPLFDEIRTAAAEVTRRARSVELHREPLAALARELSGPEAPSPVWDPAHHHRGGEASTLAFVVTLDAVNFGSGWFPRLRKRPGCSGYLTLAAALSERFEARGPLDADALRAATAAGCAALFGQDPADPDVAELMELYAAAWRDLGGLLASRYGGSFEALVAAAEGRAERLVGILAAMPFYRDEARYDGLRVPFYKRGQITAADLALAFEGSGPGHFEDRDDLTLFADNLVPHVLRHEGVLELEPELAARIERQELLPAGSPEEVEIRAVAVHAVELLGRACAAAGRPTPAWRLDHLLWLRGQRPEVKARPRHRTRTVYY